MMKPGAASPGPHAETVVDGPASGGGGPESEEGEASSRQAPDVLIGTTLHDTYIVDRVLGQGGMGRVYEARHTRIPEKRFAIKVLLQEFAFVPEIRARFQREVECVASVSHPGVIGIHDVGRTPQGWPYMVCEHLSGTDLSSHIKSRGKLPQSTVIHIGRRICEALEATHERGVIHRDLKPHNVFLVQDSGGQIPLHPQVKVLDFGLSRFVNKDDQLTKTGVVMGTPAFMAPEQAQGGTTDHLTDVYGVGAILYTAATAHPPFDEETPQMTVLAVMSREPVRPRQVEPSVSEGLEVVIQRAMAKSPDERFPDIASLKRALVNLQSAPMSIAPPPPSVDEREGMSDARVARLRLTGFMLGALLLTLVLAASASVGVLALLERKVSLTTIERVLALALLSTLLPPLYLGMRAFKRRVWENSAKVVAWIPRFRAPLLAALFAYGLAAISFRFLDDTLGSLVPGGLFGVGGGGDWPGREPLLALVALLSALAMVFHQQYWRRRPPLVRWVFGPGLFGFTGLLCVVSAHAALSFRSRALEESAKPEGQAAEVARKRATPVLPEAQAKTETEKPGEPPKQEPPKRAPDDELAAAAAGGAEALEALAKRYPADAELLKALVLDYASRASDIDKSVETIRRLLSVSAEHRSDADVRYILNRAAELKGRPSALAFDVMSNDMGSVGPDLMYELMLKRPPLEGRARKALTELRLEQRFSPALAVAYDLRFAPSCEARVRLLPRAEELGDRRAATVLSSLASRPRPCGRKRQPACRARCEKEAKQFVSTIEKISAKLGARSSKSD